VALLSKQAVRLVCCLNCEKSNCFVRLLLRLKQEFAVDNDAIKEYFPMSKVTEELLALYQVTVANERE
jgi:hypothetical protein